LCLKPCDRGCSTTRQLASERARASFRERQRVVGDFLLQIAHDSSKAKTLKPKISDNGCSAAEKRQQFLLQRVEQEVSGFLPRQALCAPFETHLFDCCKMTR